MSQSSSNALFLVYVAFSNFIFNRKKLIKLMCSQHHCVVSHQLIIHNIWKSRDGSAYNVMSTKISGGGGGGGGGSSEVILVRTCRPIL